MDAELIVFVVLAVVAGCLLYTKVIRKRVKPVVGSGIGGPRSRNNTDVV